MTCVSTQRCVLIRCVCDQCACARICFGCVAHMDKCSLLLSVCVLGCLCVLICVCVGIVNGRCWLELLLLVAMCGC